MPNLFPYTNGHELNLDWILQVVKDFQTKYTTFDQALADALAAIAAGKTEALDEISTDLTAALNDIEASQTAALTAIGNTKDSALADIGTALTNATNAISALNTTVQGEITTLRNTSLSEISTAQTAALAAISAEQLSATQTIVSLYNTLPTSAQDILNRLDIIDTIITGNTPNTFVWLQGSYTYPLGETPPTPPVPYYDSETYNYSVTSRYLTGAAGRRLRVVTDGTIIISSLLYWYNTPPGGQAFSFYPGDEGITETTIDRIVRFDSTALSIELKKADQSTITPNDVDGHIYIEWVTDFVGQRIIAPKESSTTADVAREEGEYFFLDGELYKATDDIAVGDTITEGTNCEKRTVGGELSKVNGAVSDLQSAFDHTSIRMMGDFPTTARNIDENGKWFSQGANVQFIAIPIKAGNVITISSAPASSVCAFLRSYTDPPTIGDSADFSTAAGFTSKISLSVGVPTTMTAPNDANYFLLWVKYGGSTILPQIFTINGYSLIKNVPDNINAIMNRAVTEIETEISNILTFTESLEKNGAIMLPDFPQYNGYIWDGVWKNVTNPGYKHYVIPVKSGDNVVIHNNVNSVYYAVVKSYAEPVNDAAPDFSAVSPFNAPIMVYGNTNFSYTMPSDAKYIIVISKIYNTDSSPLSCIINGYDYVKSIQENISDDIAATSPDNTIGNGKKLVVIGDSLMEAGANQGFNTWGQRIKSKLGISNLIGVSIGGTRYRHGNTIAYPAGFQNGDSLGDIDTGKAPGSDPASFCDWYRINLTIPEDADIILIGTGVNEIPTISDAAIGDTSFSSENTTDSDWANSAYYTDWNGDYDINTLKGAIASAIMKLQTKAPNAKIMACNWCNSRGTTGTNGTDTADKTDNNKVLNAISEVFSNYGIEIIDLFATSGINPMNRKEYTADGIHLNSDGYYLMGLPIEKAIRNYLRSII